MIERVRIKNFQSLHDIDLEFGNFTVIVGASSSGKSAVTRAIKAVTSNSLNSDYITRGTKSSAVTLYSNEGTVTIEREIGGSSVYKVTKTGSEESRFTKLNRQVPTQVTEALGILPSTQEVASINFAGQFDTPYLLKEGASSVARVLGELTNVSTIFSAVREASRRAKNASGLINVRKKDQDKILVQLSSYSTIKSETLAINNIETKFSTCQKVRLEVDQLRTALQVAETASETLSGIKEIKSLPDITKLLEAKKNLEDFKSILRTLAQARQTLIEQQNSIKQSTSDILSAEKELHDTLVAAGQCPTCNQSIPRDRYNES